MRNNVIDIFYPLFLTLVFAFLAWMTFFIPMMNFNRACSGHLKRAGDANTIELAIKELDQAVSWLEYKGFTEGSCHIFFAMPSNDIGFWYRNLADSLKELKSVSPDASMLERSNILMKLRETLMDQNSQGSTITKPRFMYWYPRPVVGLLVFSIFALLALRFFIVFIARMD